MSESFSVEGILYRYRHVKMDDFTWTLLVTGEYGVVIGRCQIKHDTEQVTLKSGADEIHLNYDFFCDKPLKLAELAVNFALKRVIN